MEGRKAVALAVSVVLSALVPAVAQGADFTVNTTSDAPAAHDANGKCASAAPGGGCTVRAAIQAADATSGASTILIPAGRYRLAIPPNKSDSVVGSVEGVDPSTGDLDISGAVTITGAGAGQTIIDGGGLDRVFAIENLATAHLSDMTITGGDATRGGTSQGIALGGAILNTGVVTLDRMALVGNTADGGGGMFSIPATSPVVRDSLIADNRAYSGGGLRLDAGGTIINTTITGNQLLPLPPTAVGLSTRPVPTIFGLMVDEGSGWGGGIDNRGTGNVVILNSTITDNRAIKGGGGLSAGQGYAPISPLIALGKMTIENTIVAGNTSAAGPGGCHVKDQIIQSLGHNLASDGSCFLTAGGDLPNTDPKLGRLADNGGPTQTQALLPGSPAIDAGNTAACPDHDQRGIARPPRACDIGAFQDVQAPAPTACTLTVGVPARLRAHARSFDVLAGHKVLARHRRPRQRVTVRRTRLTLRVHMRSGRVVYVHARARCQRR